MISHHIFVERNFVKKSASIKALIEGRFIVTIVAIQGQGKRKNGGVSGFSLYNICSNIMSRQVASKRRRDVTQLRALFLVNAGAMPRASRS